MKPLNDQIVNDSSLTEEEFREIRTAVVGVQPRKIAGRAAIPTRKIDAGRQEYGWDVQSDVGDADIIAKSTNFPGFKSDLVRSIVPILKHGLAFYIAREDLLSSRKYGEALDTRNALATARLTIEKENTSIIQGNTLFGVNGLYAAAGQTQAGSVWASNDPEANIRAALKKLADYNFTGDTLLVSTKTFYELHRRNTNTDRMYIELIRDAFSLRVLEDKDIAEGTALLMQTGSEIAEVIVAEELDVENEYKLEDQSYVFNTFLRSVPAVYKPNALCTLTGI